MKKLNLIIKKLNGMPNSSIINQLFDICRTDKKLFNQLKKHRRESNDFGIIDFEWIEKEVNKRKD